MESNESDREGRGPNVPAESLASAIQLLQRVRERLGLGAASRETVAEALGYNTLNGTSRRKIAALNHFDLLARNGATYRVSDLGKQILMPRNEAEHRQALVAAARKPAFYQTLFAKYEGQALPGMLPNILVREFGILPQSSEEVTRTFRETLEFAGLLRNGILLKEPDAEIDRTVERLDRTAPQSLATSQSALPLENHVSAETRPEADVRNGRRRQIYTIPLDKRGRLANVELPVPLRERDLRKISAWVAYMVNIIDDEDESEELAASQSED